MKHKFTIGCLLLFFIGFARIVDAAPGNWPVTSAFGWRIHPISGAKAYHAGVDFGLDAGTPIPAAAAGVVTFAGWLEGYGNTVIIRHNSREETLYAHQSKIAVATGRHVIKDQIIGYVGNTGDSTGPHLHIGYRVNGSWCDPLPFLRSGHSSGGPGLNIFKRGNRYVVIIDK